MIILTYKKTMQAKLQDYIILFFGFLYTSASNINMIKIKILKSCILFFNQLVIFLND